MTPTKNEIAAAIRIAVEIARVIRQLKIVPSGELYANACNTLTIDNYNAVIAMLTRQRLIRVDNHLITWIAD